MYRVRIFPQAKETARVRFNPTQVAFIDERVSQLEGLDDPTSDVSTLAIRPLVHRESFDPIFAVDEIGNVLGAKKLRIVFGVIDRRKEIIVLAIYDSFNQDPTVIQSITRVFDHYVKYGKPESQPVI